MCRREYVRVVVQHVDGEGDSEWFCVTQLVVDGYLVGICVGFVILDGVNNRIFGYVVVVHGASDVWDVVRVK